VIATSYALPFRCEVAIENPWNGREPVDLTLYGARSAGADDVSMIRARLAPFWSLADAGGFAGAAVAPWRSACSEPPIDVDGGIVRIRFAACRLDERATQCLICLLMVLHDEFSLRRVIVSPLGGSSEVLPYEPELEDPYPSLWPELSFPHQIEESESESRTLRVRFGGPLDNRQIGAVHRDLMRWGTAAAAGAYGVAPIDPRRCGCLPVNPVEHYEGEAVWAVEKCRFHPAALSGLMAVCSTIHHRLAAIAVATIE
jgi:hypothetical protein